MRWAAGFGYAALAASVATSASGGPAAPAAMHCRHPLAMAASASELPVTVIAALHPWMALRGERWNRTDAMMAGDLTAGFTWAARSGGTWIVAYSVGGIACCRTRFAAFVPAGKAGSGFRQVVDPADKTDEFGNASCVGIDRFLDAHPPAR